MGTSRHYAISYGALKGLLVVMGLGPRRSSVEIDDDVLVCKMGWGFVARVPVAHLKRAEARSGPVGGIGVHGARGRWLVNGSTKGIVTLHVDPPCRAKVMGLPVALSALSVSLEEPDRFLAEVRAQTA